jgi:hypothetical protein
MLELLTSQSHSLEAINLKRMNFDPGYSNIESIKFHRLRSISMRHCNGLTKNGLKPIVRADLPQLQQLDIKLFQARQDMAWEQMLCRHGNKLTDMKLYLSEKLDGVIEVVPQKCRKLEYLTLSLPARAPPASLLPIIKMTASLPNLHFLTLKCQISNMTVVNALSMHQFPHLQYLKLINSYSRHLEVERLKDFLSNSKPPLKSLEFQGILITEDHLYTIINYLADTLRNLKIQYIMEPVSSECLERVESVVGNFDVEYHIHINYR